MRTSTFKDHADSDMQKYAMILFKKAQSSGPCEYALIARVLAQSSMDAASTTKIKRKFETAYVIAKELCILKVKFNTFSYWTVWHLFCFYYCYAFCTNVLALLYIDC